MITIATLPFLDVIILAWRKLISFEHAFLFHNASPDLRTGLLLLVLTSLQRKSFLLIDYELLWELNTRKIVSYCILQGKNTGIKTLKIYSYRKHMAFIFCMGCVLTVETASLLSLDHFCHFVAANSSIDFSLLREISDRVKLSHKLLMSASEITSQASLRNIIKVMLILSTSIFH